MLYFFFSFLLSLGSIGLLKKALPRTRLHSNAAKPMLLGVVLYFVVFLVFALALFFSKIDFSFFAAIFIGSFVIFLVGFLNDLKNISFKTKLISQLIAFSPVILMGAGTSIAFFPKWLNAALTLIWAIFLINAFDFLNTIEGLCAGISLIITVAFLAISIATGAHSLVLFFLVLLGALLPVFYYNRPPAKLYLGSSGSMLLGFSFAFAAMQISYAPDLKHSLALFAPLLVVIVPLGNLFFDMFIRLKKGKTIFRKNGGHLILALKDRGVSSGKILTYMYLVCFFSGLSAFLITVLPVSFKFWVLFFFLLAFFCLIFLFLNYKK